MFVMYSTLVLHCIHALGKVVHFDLGLSPSDQLECSPANRSCSSMSKKKHACHGLAAFVDMFGVSQGLILNVHALNIV